jgi:hypothetical protein
MPNTGELEKYRLLWAIMWPVGMLILGFYVLRVLRTINRSIVAATQQELVRLILDGRRFFIDHVELFDGDPVFAAFKTSDEDLRKHFLRRNFITHLELLYFQNKYKAVDPAFYISHLGTLKPIFRNPAMKDVWEKTKHAHVREFQAFVDDLLKDPA